MTSAPSKVLRKAGTSQPARRPVKRRLSASHFLIALVVVLAFVLNFLALQDRTATTLVAVADRPISAGSAFSVDSVRLVPVPAGFEGLESLVEQAQLSGFEGWVVERSIPVGGLLNLSVFVEPGAPSGLRSMSLPIEVAHAAGGTIVAGDRVDVISVLDGSATYVATDIEVIGSSDLDGGSFGSVGDYHIVVAVDARQALDLAEALESSSLEIIRSTGAPGIEAESNGE
ncbi:MAG: hypothetical protein ACC658_03845 [Acidimicrobiia bacterium]